jgi:prenylcysteine oxidase/farnesylcysteine lyase
MAAGRFVVIVRFLVCLLLACRCCYGLQVCIVGSGMGGASAAFFLRNYSTAPLDIDIFEQNDKVGGRMAVVELAGDTFEAGASILHPKNLHAVNFVNLLGLKPRSDPDDEGFGIWNGSKFVFKTANAGDSFISKITTQILNTLAVMWRYGTSLWNMQNYVSDLLEKFLLLYQEGRPGFETVEELLKSVDLYESTQYPVQELLVKYGLSNLIIDELVTFIMRINYGQNVSISGMAGGVSLCGSGGDLWAVEGGNWQIPEGLIRYTNASLHLKSRVVSVTLEDSGYIVELESGGTKACDTVILATSLDESKIEINPKVKLPQRSMQHTYTTFIRGLLNAEYFGMSSDTIPDLIGTVEDPAIPFSSINVLKEYSVSDKAYKAFSRAPLSDELLDKFFSTRSSTIRIDWAAYPHYTPPEKFAPYILDGHHLYYVNAFENAASSIETSAVSAQNVVRILLSRLLHGNLEQPKLSSVAGLIKDGTVEDL